MIAKSEPRSNPVAPNSVHVWRGFKSPSKSYGDFATFLGSVFVPACALLQPNAGLRAYIPSMPSQLNKPAGVPDQTALMFWQDQDAYSNAFKTPAVRAYTNLHGDAYGPGSSAQFPVALEGSVKAEQPYFLIDQPADWMLGGVRHLVGARRGGTSNDDFLKAIYTWAAGYQKAVPAGVDAALLCAGDNYVVFWEHWAPGTPPSASPVAQLAETVDLFLFKEAESIAPGGGLWDAWPGFDLTRQDCINIKLDRPVAGEG